MHDLFQHSVSPVAFEFCNTPEKNTVFRNIIDRHHQYMDYKDTCNRRLNWLIYEDRSGNLIGGIGVNSAILALGERDKYIGWNKTQRNKNLNMVGNNYRFALIQENITEENIGSQVLKMLRKIAPALWKARYGNDLVLLESLVKPPWTGAVYKADNWILVGMTKGFSFSKAPVSFWKKETGKRGYMARHHTKASIEKYAVGGTLTTVKRSEPKLIFIRPLCRNWRKTLDSNRPTEV